MAVAFLFDEAKPWRGWEGWGFLWRFFWIGGFSGFDIRPGWKAGGTKDSWRAGGELPNFWEIVGEIENG
jgi:hypothetical protein